MTAPEKLVYDAPEVAAVLGISERHAREMLRRGHIPAIRLGKRWLCPKVQLDEFLRTTKAVDGAA